MNLPAKIRSQNVYLSVLVVIYLLAIIAGLASRNMNMIILSLSVALLPPIIFLFVFRLRLLALLTVFLIPLSVKMNVGAGAIVSVPGEALILAIAVIFIIYSLIREAPANTGILSHPITILILLDLGWSVFTALIGELPVISLKRIVIKTIFTVVFYFLFLEIFRNRKNLWKPWILYGFGMIIPITWTLYNHSHYEFSKVVAFLMPLPFYNDHTLYATCIAFILPFIFLLALRPDWFGFQKSSRFIFLALTFMLYAGEFFSFSRAAWLSIAAGLVAGLLIVFLRFRAIHLLMLVIIASSILGYYSRDIYLYIEKVDAVSRQDDVGEHMQSVMNISTDASNLERINRWQCALRMFRDKPVVGFGPGSYMFVYGRYQVTTEMTRISTNHGEKGNAHSEYLMYLSEMGIVGLAIFLLVIYIAVSRAIRIFHRTDDKAVKWLILTLLIGFISYLFHGNFNSFIDTDKASVLFYGFLALVVAVERFHTFENKAELKV